MTTSFPNLNAEFEDDMTGVFPKVDEYLFIGGPEHGKRREVATGDPVFKVFTAPPSTPSPFLADGGAGGYEVHTYVKRELGFEDQDRTNYTRTVYVHEEVPNPQVAQQLVMAALLTDFIKGGRKVVPNGPVAD